MLMKMPTLSIICLSILTLLFTSSVPYLASGQECSANPVNYAVAILAKNPLPVEDHGFSLHHDGQDSILIFSGNEEDNRAIFRFNVTSEDIEKIAPLPMKGEYAPLASLHDGETKLYFGNDQYAPRVLNFDSASSTGRVVAELPYNFNNLVGSFTSSDPKKIYLLRQTGGNLSVHEFDTTTYCMSWTKNVTAWSTAISATLGEHHYVFTGQGFGNNGRAFTINRETLANTTLGETNVEFYYTKPTAVVTNNYLYVMGGHNRGKPFPTDGILRYDPGQNTFSFIRIDGFPIGYGNTYGQSPSMVYVERMNRIYFFGGRATISSTVTPFNHIWYIDVSLME